MFLERDDCAVFPLDRSVGAVQVLVDEIPEELRAYFHDFLDMTISKRVGATAATISFVRHDLVDERDVDFTEGGHVVLDCETIEVRNIRDML